MLSRASRSPMVGGISDALVGSGSMPMAAAVAGSSFPTGYQDPVCSRSCVAKRVTSFAGPSFCATCSRPASRGNFSRQITIDSDPDRRAFRALLEIHAPLPRDEQRRTLHSDPTTGRDPKPSLGSSTARNRDLDVVPRLEAWAGREVNADQIPFPVHILEQDR